MFKRLSKARRHSADDTGNPANQDEPPGGGVNGRRVTSEPYQGLNSTLLKTTRPKCPPPRRSCGDVLSIQQIINSANNEQQESNNATMETDYQMVTAVPAFIVEHEPEKQRGLGVWGRIRMSKKIESFRRSGSRETICTIAERPDASTTANNNNINNNNNPTKPSKLDNNGSSRVDQKSCSQRSPSPFKSFFIRMGSTGMLNSSKSNNKRSQNPDERHKSTEKDNLFRSCSTSQLNTSPTYVKGDDPSEGIDLQINNRKDKTVSCDNLARQQDDDVFDDQASLRSLSSTVSHNSTTSFSPCNFTAGNGEMRKSSSCDFKEAKKSSFPYAFLRSRLSVLPEEKQQGAVTATKDERTLFKATSEEHFPAMKIEESFEGTTTLGRRRPSRNNGTFGMREQSSGRLFHELPTTASARNSYAEFRTPTAEDRYSLNSANLEKIESGLRHDDNNCYYTRSPSLRLLDSIGQDRIDFAPRSSIVDSTSTELDMVATLRNNHRRNSMPNGEQRLSSHYVSSNESGYDSDGPRGESAAASENEAQFHKCTTDSSDTSSVIDSEIEKPIRSSTPSEMREHDNAGPGNGRESINGDVRDNVDGLRWHQSNSGRILPSIHQSSYNDGGGGVASRLSVSEDIPRIPITAAAEVAAPPPPHRVRLQQDKTRFLSDIIQASSRVKRCRMVQLHKSDPKESLGIRLAQQRNDGLRYIVVQLENDGIAHRDGRLRLGDEIVEVEGKELRTLETLEEVQEYLKSISNCTVRLMTAYEESVPQVYFNGNQLPGEYEYLENARNLSNMTMEDGRSQVTHDKQLLSLNNDAVPTIKRPDFLPLTILKDQNKSIDNSDAESSEAHQYLTRHIARFEKGIGRPSLGFSVVGGKDSPRGDMGIFVRRVFPGGQADVSKSLFQGDEIITLNGKVLRGHTHQEVIELFKGVREGAIELELARRHRLLKNPLKSTTY